MEKISGIVRGNARVKNADNKNAAAARTGMPAFGRPPGESTPASVKTSTTASRAVALHNANIEAKKAVSQERVVAQMADDFFMRTARPEEVLQEAIPVDVPVMSSTNDLVMADVEAQEVQLPEKDYTPRGSFVDVRA